MNRQIVTDMFLDNKSAYSIHLKTGISFSEIAHYIRENEEAKFRHKRAIANERKLLEAS